MGKDWVDWHRQYDDETSALSQRLSAVQKELLVALNSRRKRESNLINVCAGQGDDVLGVLARARPRIRVRLGWLNWTRAWRG